MKILVTATSFFSDDNLKAQQKLSCFADKIVKNPQSHPLTSEELIPLLDGIDGYIAGLNTIDEQAINAMPSSVKVISRYGAGVDRVDVNAAQKRGITVTNTPAANTRAVAELAMGFIFSLARSIPDLDKRVKNKQWPRVSGREIQGATLGIIGFGSIGRELGKIAVGCGMKVIASDLCFNDDFAQKHGIINTETDNLIKSSDFISLHIPMTPENKHFMNNQRISSMKRGSFLINTARGELIDEAAALKHLKSGHLGGLALDTFEVEPPLDNPLFLLDNVIATPHTGAHTHEAVANMGNMAVDNLIAELSGIDCGHRVTW